MAWNRRTAGSPADEPSSRRSPYGVETGQAHPCRDSDEITIPSCAADQEVLRQGPQGFRGRSEGCKLMQCLFHMLAR